MTPEQGATALQERNQFDLAAAQRQGEMLLAHGTDEGRQALATELLANSGNIAFSEGDFEGVSDEARPAAELELAMDVATEASKYGLTAETTADDLKTMYAKLIDDAAEYRNSGNVDPKVAKAKDALAAGVWNKLDTPAAADLSNW